MKVGDVIIRFALNSKKHGVVATVLEIHQVQRMRIKMEILAHKTVRGNGPIIRWDSDEGWEVIGYETR